MQHEHAPGSPRKRRLDARPAWLLLIGMLAAGPGAQTQLGTTTQITGRVIDESGEPIAGAAVGVTGAAAFVDSAKLLAEPLATTAADGSYTVTVPAARNSAILVIAADGRQTCAIAIDRGLAGTAASLGQTLLVPGRTLKGRVNDERGAPVAGARLRVESSIADAFRPGRARVLGGAVSDTEGRFVVPGVPLTGLRLIVEADGFLTESRLVAQQSIRISFRKVGLVRGKVVDEHGAPAPGIRVRTVTVEAGIPSQETVSAADGSFALTPPKVGLYCVRGSAPSPPHRSFTTRVLRGPANDVVLTASHAVATAPRILEVTVVGANDTPIPRFLLSQVTDDPSDLHSVLPAHRTSRRAYEGKLELAIDAGAGPVRCLVVDAPGCGFEVVPLPDDPERALTVTLGPEVVLTGRVRDAGTGKPMAGVAVRALPATDQLRGGGCAVDRWPVSDAEGNYRIERLRPGEYSVQAHAAGRPASATVATTLKAAAEHRLDLAVPQERWLQARLTGSIPKGPAPELSCQTATRVGPGHSYYQHRLPAVAPLPLRKAGLVRLGPFGLGPVALQVFIASRTRCGAGATIALSSFDPDAASWMLRSPTCERASCKVASTSNKPCLASASACLRRRLRRKPHRVGRRHPRHTPHSTRTVASRSTCRSARIACSSSIS